MSYFGMTFYRFFREMDRFDIKEANSAGSDGKESTCNAGDLGSIPGLERSPGEENGNPLQYSCLGNPVDKGAWQATVDEVAKVGMPYRLSMHSNM